MTAAAASSDHRTSDLLEELEQIVKQLDTLSSAAQEVIRTVVQSLLGEGDLTAAEITHLNALFMCVSPGGHARPALGPAQRESKRAARRGVAIAIAHRR